MELAWLHFQLPDDEHDLSDRELQLDDSAALSDLHWHDTSADSALSPQPSSNHSLSLAQPLRSERSGRDTPASVDSIPLEWDHDYDLSRDLESAVSRTLTSEDEEGQEDKDFYHRGAVGLSGRKEFFLYFNVKGNEREWILYRKHASSAESSSAFSPQGNSYIREHWISMGLWSMKVGMAIDLSHRYLRSYYVTSVLPSTGNTQFLSLHSRHVCTRLATCTGR